MGRQSGLSAQEVRRIGDAVDGIYAASGATAIVANFFDCIRSLIPCETAVYFPFDSETGFPATEGYVGYGTRDVADTAQRYGSYYARLDPLKDRTLPQNINQPLRTSDVLSRKEIVDSEYYTDFLGPLGIGYVMGCAVGVPGHALGGVGLHRSVGSRGFDDKEKTLFALLAPHLGCALQGNTLLEHSARALRTEAARAEQRHLHVWESDELAVFVFDTDLRLRHTSADAAALSQEWYGFSPEDQRLTLSSLPPPIQRLLVGLKGRWEGEGGANILVQPFAQSICLKLGEKHYLFTAAVASSTAGKHASASLLLTVERLPTRCRVVSSLSRYDLTRREKEITVLVLQGLGNRAIAARLHITEQTVKDHLRVVYRKLGVATRANLLSKLLWSKQFS